MHILSYISSDFPIGQHEKLRLNKRFPTAELDELYVDAQTLGNLMVYFDAEDEAHVIGVAEAHLLPERVELDGKRLVIEANNFKRFLKQGQAEKIRLEVHVPARTRLNAHFGAGVLFLAGGEGAITVSGGVGEISGYSYAKHITMKLHAGEVTLTNLQGQAELNMNVGRINLEWSEFSGNEHVEAKCNLGCIDLHLPEGIAIVEEKGGIFLRKTVDIPFSTYIDARVGFGGLDVVPTEPEHVLV